MDRKANRQYQMEHARDIIRIIDQCTHDGRLTERQKDDICHSANALAELVVAYHAGRIPAVPAGTDPDADLIALTP